jgi:hypothetical protein
LYCTSKKISLPRWWVWAAASALADRKHIFAGAKRRRAGQMSQPGKKEETKNNKTKGTK